MKENTNKTLLINTIILYIRLIVNVVCGFATTRFALQALGIVDFGLFSVVGGIISFISIINTIMLSTSNRYIAVAVGNNNIKEANKVFNTCQRIHISIAILTTIIALPIGLYYIYNFLNYSGDINNAIVVFIISVTASIFSFITVPHHGLITAKERFFVFCIPDIISHLLRVLVAYLLMFHFNNKLIIYSSFISLMSIVPCIIYIFYCKRRFYDIVRWNKHKDSALMKEISIFSAWVGYGAIAMVGKNQGAAVIVNMFFDTVMNTAMGIGNSINGAVQMFANSLSQPISPQITKSYASGDTHRSNQLLIMAVKFTYFAVLLISSPFLIDCEWILSLWLGQIPPYSVIFTKLIIIQTLILALNSGVKEIIFASGNIKLFQIIPSTINLLALIFAYFVLKMGYPSYSVFYVYICFSIAIVFVNQWILHKSVVINSKALFREAFIPIILVTILFLPIVNIEFSKHSILNILFIFSYLCLLIFFVGLSKDNRTKLFSIINFRKNKS